MMKVWVLLREENDYNQHGEYFVKVFRNRPTIEELNQLKLQLSIQELIDLHEVGSSAYSYRSNTVYWLVEELI